MARGLSICVAIVAALTAIWALVTLDDRVAHQAAAARVAPAPTATPPPTPIAPTATPAPTPTSTPAPTATPTPTPTPALGAEQPGVPEPRVRWHVDARQWPEGFDELASQVSEIRGPFRYEAPEFILTDGQGMADRLLATQQAAAATSAAVEDAYARVDDVFRALGLTTDEFDVTSENVSAAELADGVYSLATHTITLQIDTQTLADLGEGGNAIAVSERPDVGARLVDDAGLADIAVHEIAHAWQGPGRQVAMQLASRADAFVARALIEGEAEWVTGEWRADQPPDVRAVIAAARTSGVDRAREVSPEVLVAQAQLPYLLGGRLYTAVDANSGMAGFDDLLNPGRIVTGAALADPHRWVAGENRSHTTFSPVPAPANATPVSYIGPPVSAPHWFLIFASVNPLSTALGAARSITSTSQPGVWADADGRTCLGIDLDAAPEGRDAVAQALEAWTQADVTTRTALESGPFRWAITTCDPGPGAASEPLVGPLDAAYALSAVIDAEAWALESGRSLASGRCLALVVLPDQVADATDGDTWRATLNALDPTQCPG